MAYNAPGLHWRKGMSLMDAVNHFSNEEEVERLFVDACWQGEIACPECGSNDIAIRANLKPQPFHCRDCRFNFSVKISVIQSTQ